MSPLDLSIIDAAAKLRDGSLTSVALTEASLDRIAERDAVYRAFVALDAERALEASAAADREIQAGKDRGPLHGIPIAVKDLIDTAGLRTAYGSRIFEAEVPKEDAEVRTKSRARAMQLLHHAPAYRVTH